MKRLILCALIICLLFCSGCTEENLESRAEQGQIRYEDLTYNCDYCIWNYVNNFEQKEVNADGEGSDSE